MLTLDVIRMGYAEFQGRWERSHCVWGQRRGGGASEEVKH
jgi:hypothetical protein